MKRWQWLIWLFSIGLLMIGCQTGGGEEEAAVSATTTVIPPLPALSPEEITLGEQIYAAHCARCHGVNLEGEANWKERNEDSSFRAPPHDASGHTWHHDDSVLIESVVLGGTRFEEINIGGTSNMPAFGEVLTAEEITAVLTYIKSTWPGEIRQMQWEATVMMENQ